MHLFCHAPSRYVLLIVDDEVDSIATRLRCAGVDAEVVSCSSCEGAWIALTSGRRYSAVVAFGVDPDVAQAAARVGTPVVRVGRRSHHSALAAAVAARARPVRVADGPLELGPAPVSSPWRQRRDGRLVAVCGPGGTGASLVAAALAVAGLCEHNPSPPALDRPAAPPSAGRPAVLLADFALRADQAYLHGLGETGGLLRLVEAGRYRPVTMRDIRRETVAQTGFRLLPGLVRPGHWTAVSPSAFDQLLPALTGTFDLTVADITGDFEGEADSGSFDIEERNHIARRTARAADIVVVVGGPGANGARRLACLVDDLLDLGVDPARIQPVVNQVEPRPVGPTPRRLCGLPAVPVELPREPLGASSGGLLPPWTARPLVAAVSEMLASVPGADRRQVPERVMPGSLGCLAP